VSSGCNCWPIAADWERWLAELERALVGNLAPILEEAGD
jgi:hypothetical protein